MNWNSIVKKNTPHSKLPKVGFLYLNHVLRFFDHSNFRGWPDRIEEVVYRWGNDKQRFINDVKSKNIDVLVGNIPATAYETFREIARALPEVRFIPSLDTQFANKSKENVTHFCKKHNLPIPKTDIFYEQDDAIAFLKNTDYPKIIKKSYGPSNYGGYFVHKVDSFDEATQLLQKKKYYPVYVQQFVPMQADIRVMLVGHKPLCAFWRRPPEGEWLTNTSQGGSMDYQNVPQEALDIAVAASKAAKAEYWACDIALGVDNQYRILECATAFAAFPYVRDWIGSYIMWDLSNGRFRAPNIPNYNWEELGKLSSSVLRVMRHITFGNSSISEDCADSVLLQNRADYPLLPVELRMEHEEWPSETWNYQDNYTSKSAKSPNNGYNVELSANESRFTQEVAPQLDSNDTGQEDSEAIAENTPEHVEIALSEEVEQSTLNENELRSFFKNVNGIGTKTVDLILNNMSVLELNNALSMQPEKLLSIPSIKQKRLELITDQWLKMQG